MSDNAWIEKKQWQIPGCLNKCYFELNTWIKSGTNVLYDADLTNKLDICSKVVLCMDQKEVEFQNARNVPHSSIKQSNKTWNKCLTLHTARQRLESVLRLFNVVNNKIPSSSTLPTKFYNFSIQKGEAFLVVEV